MYADLHAPEDGLVLQVQACGVCGSDLRRWKEGIPVGGSPMTPGHEIAGIVIEVGARVQATRRATAWRSRQMCTAGTATSASAGYITCAMTCDLVGITPGYPGGFAEQMILTGEILTNGIVHPMPDRDDFCACRAG